MTLKEKCKQLGLSISEVVEMSGTSRETLRNWLTDKPKLLTVVLDGVYFRNIINNLPNTLDIDK